MTDLQERVNCLENERKELLRSLLIIKQENEDMRRHDEIKREKVGTKILQLKETIQSLKEDNERLSQERLQCHELRELQKELVTLMELKQILKSIDPAEVSNKEDTTKMASELQSQRDTIAQLRRENARLTLHNKELMNEQVRGVFIAHEKLPLQTLPEIDDDIHSEFSDSDFSLDSNSSHNKREWDWAELPGPPSRKRSKHDDMNSDGSSSSRDDDDSVTGPIPYAKFEELFTK